MSETLLIKNINLQYANKTIFSKLELPLHIGQWTALVGTSGIGKSSLLRLLAGLMPDQTPNQSLTGFLSEKPHPFTADIAYMAQTDLLLPWLNVLDNVCLGAKLRHENQNFIYEKAKHLLLQVKLSHATTLFPHQLSGGMRQRVALVRTLLEDKPIVLMDEPFSALDTITRYQLQALAAQLLKNHTVLFITHDPAEALRLAHHVYIMQNQPATLKLIATLKTQPPRAINDPELIPLQAKLLSQLAAEK